MKIVSKLAKNLFKLAIGAVTAAGLLLATPAIIITGVMDSAVALTAAKFSKPENAKTNVTKALVIKTILFGMVTIPAAIMIVNAGLVAGFAGWLLVYNTMMVTYLGCIVLWVVKRGNITLG